MRFRLLKPGDIEVKVKQVLPEGVIALLYKTARVDMDVLDETVGPENWSDDYKEIKGNLYCGITINGVTKWDCGIESREDIDGNQKKGEASDAFKRAGFKWGIGRELYSSPFVWIPAENVTIKTKKVGGKDVLYTKDRFSVLDIAYNQSNKISRLIIQNHRETIVFAFQTKEKPEGSPAYQCADCGAELEPVKKRDGDIWSVTDMAAYGQKRFDRVLCPTCMKKAEKA